MCDLRAKLNSAAKFKFKIKNPETKISVCQSLIKPNPNHLDDYNISFNQSSNIISSKVNYHKHTTSFKNIYIKKNKMSFCLNFRAKKQ